MHPFISLGGVMGVFASMALASQALSQPSSDAALEKTCRANEPTAPDSCPCTITKARAGGLTDAELASLFKDDGHSDPVSPAKYGRFWEVKATCIAEATMASMGISPSNPLPGVPAHMRPNASAATPPLPPRDTPYVARPNSGTPLPADTYIGTRPVAEAATTGSLSVGRSVPVSLETSTNDLDARTTLTETYRFTNFDYLFGYDTVIRDNAKLFAMAKASAQKDIPQWRESFSAGSRIRGEVSHSWSTYGSLDRLLTISVTGYTNNRPQGQFIDAMLWDSVLDRAIGWTDVFDAGQWNGSIRRSYCAALQAERRARGTQQNTSCPDFGQLLIGFERGQNGQIRLSMAALAYVAGSYAEGPYEVTLPLDADVLAAVKEPYRRLFAANGTPNTVSLVSQLGAVEGATWGDAACSTSFYLMPADGRMPVSTDAAWAYTRQTPSVLIGTLVDASSPTGLGLKISLGGSETIVPMLRDTADEDVFEGDGIAVRVKPNGTTITDNPAYGFSPVSVAIMLGSDEEVFDAIDFSAC